MTIITIIFNMTNAGVEWLHGFCELVKTDS